MKKQGKIFPVMLRVAERRCVVVGGGEVALRKVRALVAGGGKVRLISPEAVKGLRTLSRGEKIEWKPRRYRRGDLAGAFLAVAAADQGPVNRRVAEEARARGVLLNVVDDPEGGDYQVMSFFEEGDLLVAVSTQGLSPALSRTLRRMIQEYLGPSFPQALAIIAGFRERVKTQIADPKARLRFWESALTPPVLHLARRGNLAGLRRILGRKLQAFQNLAGSPPRPRKKVRKTGRK